MGATGFESAISQLRICESEERDAPLAQMVTPLATRNAAQEISSAPVILWDIFRNSHDLAKEESKSAALVARLAAARDNIQAVAAISFITVRGFEFSRVTLTRFLPDVLTVLPAAGAYRPLLCTGLGIALLFNALQLFWLWQILTTMIDKIFRGGDGEPPEIVSQR